MLRLDYVSCCLTILSTFLIGRKLWQGWIAAGVNSAVICVIGWETRQTGFIAANLFCIALYAFNLSKWRSRAEPPQELTEKIPLRLPRPRPTRLQKQRLIGNAKHHMTSRSIRIPD